MAETASAVAGKERFLPPSHKATAGQATSLGMTGTPTMYENTEFSLSRDCEAIQIPSGQKTTIPAGTAGVITQTLGGSYTIATYQGLARVGEKDLDALGLEKPASTNGAAEKAASPTSGEVDDKAVWDQLRQCFDPEIPVNIVDLGLVYDCQLTKRPEGGVKVDVKMTLTAPGCGMGPA